MMQRCIVNHPLLKTVNKELQKCKLFHFVIFLIKQINAKCTEILGHTMLEIAHCDNELLIILMTYLNSIRGAGQANSIKIKSQIFQAIVK